jgi:hypothetical protein
MMITAVPRIRGSLVGASLLLAWDAVLSGGFVLSILVSPVWFLVSLAKAIIQRPGWRVGLTRILVPVLTLGLVLGNAAMQTRIASANAKRIIEACEQFRIANGRYPSTLDELKPGYLASVPRAKYSLMFGNFWYWSLDGKTRLMWVVIPPFGRKIYDFEGRKWGSLD